jgi:predicted RecA/RadA family phage recombinase
MAKVATYKHPGAIMDWENGTSADVSVGDVISLGTFCGVAQMDIADGDTGPVALSGVYEVDSVNNAGFSQGDLIYFDTVAKKATKDASKAFLGVAMRDKETAGTTAWVKIGYEWHDKAEKSITYTNSGDEIAAGDVVKFSDFCGIAAETIAASTGEGAVYIEGTFELASVTNASFAAGDRLYIDADGKLSKLATIGNIPIGVAADAKETAAATAFVTLSRDVNPRAEDVITYANGGAEIVAGAVVKFADFVGIAAETIAASTGTGRVYVTGSYTLTAVNNAAFAAGDLLYVDGDGKLSKVDTYPAIPAGICAVAKAEADTTATVRLGPGIPRLATAQG